MTDFEIRDTMDKGRAMFAKRSFQKDEIILEECPFVSAQFSWNREYKYLVCEYCLRPLESPEENVRRLTHDPSITLPPADLKLAQQLQQQQTQCPHCDVQYCSEDCRIDAAQKYHMTLCMSNINKKSMNPIEHPLNRLDDAWRKIHYPPETTTIQLIIKLLAMYIQSENKEEVLVKLQDFQNKSINVDQVLNHKMLGANFLKQLQDLYPLYLQAFPNESISMFQSFEAFKTFFAIIGTNGQGIGTSPFSDWVKYVTAKEATEDEKCTLDIMIDDLYDKLDEVTGIQFINNEGAGLYTNQSKINHSCDPNAQPSFPHSNHKVCIKALRDIESGEEICISYLDECMLKRSRHSRQKELMENYIFLCRCGKCEEQWDDPSVTSDDDDDDDEEDDDCSDAMDG